MGIICPLIDCIGDSSLQLFGLKYVYLHYWLTEEKEPGKQVDVEDLTRCKTCTEIGEDKLIFTLVFSV